jgi:cell division protease FtsH
MSEKLGSVRYAGQRLQYLGSAIAESTDASAATQETIDAEVRRIVGEQFERAKALLSTHRDALSRLSSDLLKAESLDGRAVLEALASSAQAVVS